MQINDSNSSSISPSYFQATLIANDAEKNEIIFDLNIFWEGNLSLRALYGSQFNNKKYPSDLPGDALEKIISFFTFCYIKRGDREIKDLLSSDEISSYLNQNFSSLNDIFALYEFVYYHGITSLFAFIASKVTDPKFLVNFSEEEISELWHYACENPDGAQLYIYILFFRALYRQDYNPACIVFEKIDLDRFLEWMKFSPVSPEHLPFITERILNRDHMTEENPSENFKIALKILSFYISPLFKNSEEPQAVALKKVKVSSEEVCDSGLFFPLLTAFKLLAKAASTLDEKTALLNLFSLPKDPLKLVNCPFSETEYLNLCSNGFDYKLNHKQFIIYSHLFEIFLLSLVRKQKTEEISTLIMVFLDEGENRISAFRALSQIFRRNLLEKAKCIRDYCFLIKLYSQLIKKYKNIENLVPNKRIKVNKSKVAFKMKSDNSYNQLEFVEGFFQDLIPLDIQNMISDLLLPKEHRFLLYPLIAFFISSTNLKDLTKEFQKKFGSLMKFAKLDISSIEISNEFIQSIKDNKNDEIFIAIKDNKNDEIKKYLSEISEKLKINFRDTVLKVIQKLLSIDLEIAVNFYLNFKGSDSLQLLQTCTKNGEEKILILKILAKKLMRITIFNFSQFTETAISLCNTNELEAALEATQIVTSLFDSYDLNRVTEFEKHVSELVKLFLKLLATKDIRIIRFIDEYIEKKSEMFRSCTSKNQFTLAQLISCGIAAKLLLGDNFRAIKQYKESKSDIRLLEQAIQFVEKKISIEGSTFNELNRFLYQNQGKLSSSLLIRINLHNKDFNNVIKYVNENEMSFMSKPLAFSKLLSKILRTFPEKYDYIIKELKPLRMDRLYFEGTVQCGRKLGKVPPHLINGVINRFFISIQKSSQDSIQIFKGYLDKNLESMNPYPLFEISCNLSTALILSEQMADKIISLRMEKEDPEQEKEKV